MLQYLKQMVMWGQMHPVTRNKCVLYSFGGGVALMVNGLSIKLYNDRTQCSL